MGGFADTGRAFLGNTTNCKLKNIGDDKRKMRSKWDIIYDILKVIREGNGNIKMRDVATRTGMRWARFCKYSDLLVQQNLIVMSQEVDCYKIKRKGVQVLKGIEKLNSKLK